jgi:hypothetical protein
VRGQPKEILKPFQKGNDPRRNLKGAPKSFKEHFNESSIQTIIEKLEKLGKAGNVKAIEMILDRFYGKPNLNIDHTTLGEAINRITYEITKSEKPEDTNN